MRQVGITGRINSLSLSFSLSLSLSLALRGRRRERTFAQTSAQKDREDRPDLLFNCHPTDFPIGWKNKSQDFIRKSGITGSFFSLEKNEFVFLFSTEEILQFLCFTDHVDFFSQREVPTRLFLNCTFFRSCKLEERLSLEKFCFTRRV